MLPIEIILIKAEKNYYCTKLNLCAQNVRETWKILRVALNSSTSSFNNYVDHFVKDGIIIDNPCDVVEHFNNYFVNIVDDLAGKIPTNPLFFSHPILKSFSFLPCDVHEVIRISNGLNNKDSFGYDLIPPNIVKNCITQIAEPLSYIINCSFQTGLVPDQLKIAKVCPIFMNGDKNSFCNYRPISVLPRFSKIFEKAVYNRLESWVMKNNVLSNNQFGFRAKHSTSMALLEMYDHITQSFEKSDFSIGIFFDWSKAFDTVNYNIMFTKLKNYGIRGLKLKWFRNYLSNRKQYVYFNEFSSGLRSVTSGVPQGSILGSLLFVLYINEVVRCSNIMRFVLFADDINLFYKFNITNKNM